MHCLHRNTQQRMDDHANLQISETAESRIVPKWLFPPRFLNKDRFTSSHPDFVLVTPIAAKTQKQQTNLEGWILHRSRGQLRETGSTPAAPPATSTATNPRQHRPIDLFKTRRDIHLVEIKYCEDTRPQNQLNAAKEGTAQRPLQHSPNSLRYSPHHPFGCGRHHLQHPHAEAFQGTGSRLPKSQAPPLHMLIFTREGIVVAHLTRLVHTHISTTNLLQMVSVGQGTMATKISATLHADLGNFGHT